MANGIGWPNASAQATPPLPLETYLISDCLGNYDPRWSQYLPVGTLSIGQRVPTTSSTQVATYGIVQEVGQTFGPLVAEPVTNIYGNCDAQATIQLHIVPGEDCVYVSAISINGGSVSFYSGGGIPFTCYAYWDIPDGDRIEVEIDGNDAEFADQLWEIADNGPTTMLVVNVSAGGYPINVSSPIIYGVHVNNFYNYGDASQNNTTQTVTPEGDLWDWKYIGQY